MQREAGEEAVLARLKSREPDPSYAGESCLLGDDLNVTKGVEHGYVVSSKIKYGRLCVGKQAFEGIGPT
jgi:hypothetical protein